jgi:transcriptional regulator with XRE-family HTH domain
MASSIAELLTASAVHPVRTARTLRELSVKELAKRSGIHRTALSHIENGSRQPDEGQKARIAMALEVDAAELFPPPLTTRTRRPQMAITPKDRDARARTFHMPGDRYQVTGEDGRVAGVFGSVDLEEFKLNVQREVSAGSITVETFTITLVERIGSAIDDPTPLEGARAETWSAASPD